MRPALALLPLLLAPGRAQAHASEQAFVLLLPTEIYIASGVATVAATVLLLAVLPARWISRLFGPHHLALPNLRVLRPVTSTLAALLLAALFVAGLVGPTSPTENPLPLFVWTVFWIALVTLQALLGNLWSWLNPWTGPLALIRTVTGMQPLARLPAALYPAIGIASFLAFAALLLVDPAPADPPRLARIVALYWLLTLLAAVIFGPRWLRRAEGLTMMLTVYSRLGLITRRRAGFNGWQIVGRRALPLGPAILAVILLGTGSFDGLNETFLWHDLIGVNPLEFPGRSAIVAPTTLGLLLANLALLAVTAACIRAGTRLAKSNLSLAEAFRRFAPSVLPIALGYHIAHYLTAFLVDGQYLLVALSDPLDTGADWLGLGPHYVSTGFFNTRATVRAIFLTQAAAVVAGHVLAVLLAHAVALRSFADTRRAALSQAPLAAFMIAYTLFGLWLLAAPRI